MNFGAGSSIVQRQQAHGVGETLGLAMTGNLFSDLWLRFAADNQRVFLECPDRPAIRYDEMEALTGRFGAALAELGVASGDRVVAQADKSPEAIALYLACLRIGAVYVPLNTAYTAAEVSYFLRDCAPRLLICSLSRREELRSMADAADVPMMLALTGEHSLAAHAAGCAPDSPLVSRRCDDPASIVYTSGTTGRAKGAMLTVGNLRANALALHQTWGWQRDDVLLHALPVFHVHGLFVALHCAVLSGSRVLFLPRFEVGAVRRALPQATVMMGVPTFYTRLLADPKFTARDCRNIRLFISGSAPLSPVTFAEFQARTGLKILERYGMSEAGIITSNPLDGDRLAGTVGYPLPEVEVRVVTSAGEAATTGKVGELEIRGPHVFAGYWQQPEKTSAEFRADGFFRTGDLVQQAADGRITIVGRARDLIISGGYNIYPREIESLLDDLSGVAESAVIGVAHPDLGEAVVAVITVPQGAHFDETAALTALAERMARFKQPRRFVVVDELPRNAMGKVEKNVLRERYSDLFASD